MKQLTLKNPIEFEDGQKGLLEYKCWYKGKAILRSETVITLTIDGEPVPESSSITVSLDGVGKPQFLTFRPTSSGWRPDEESERFIEEVVEANIDAARYT